MQDNNKQEIELKFLFTGDEQTYRGYPHKRIHQCYLSIHPEVRLRKVEAEEKIKYVMTVKGEGDLSRSEYEITIPESTYLDLKKNMVGEEIVKTRYKVPIYNNNLVADVDIFESHDLNTVEVEFESEADASYFVALPWFGRDVTINPVYKNKYIAMHGLLV